MRAGSAEAVAGAVGELVDAAGADPRRWQAVLEALTEGLPGVKAALQVVDRRSGRGTPMLAAGFAPGVVEAYGAHYGAENPWAPVMVGAPSLEILYSEDLMPAASFAHTAFYTDWLAPGGGIDASTAIKVVDADGRLGIACLHFDVRRAERENRLAAPILTALGPRMRDALTLNRLTANPDAMPEATSEAALLEAVADPALILTAALKVVAANGPAQRLVEEGRLGVGAGDALAVPDPRLRRAIEAEVARACGGAAAVSGASSEGGYTVGAALLRPGALRAGLGPLLWGGPLVLAVLRPALTADPRAVLGRSYRLTPAEARLALAMDGTMSLRAVAERLGIGYATARSQLKSVFLKTGTARQAELVALLLRAGLIDRA